MGDCGGPSAPPVKRPRFRRSAEEDMDLDMAAGLEWFADEQEAEALPQEALEFLLEEDYADVRWPERQRRRHSDQGEQAPEHEQQQAVPIAVEAGGLHQEAEGQGAAAPPEEAEELMMRREQVLLNQDLTKTIFNNLHVLDICKAACVCRTWRSVTDDPDFWSTVSLEDRSVTQEQVLRLCRRHNAIKRLVLSGNALPLGDEHFLDTMLPFLTRLSQLELSSCALSSASLRAIGNHAPHLRDLRLSELHIHAPPIRGPMPVPNPPIPDATLSHRHLVSLSLEHVSVQRLAVNCPLLQRLTLAHCQVSSLPVLSLPALTYLDLSGSAKLAEGGLLTVTGLTTLTHLQLQSLPLSDELLRQLSQGLVALTHLDLSHASGISNLGVIRGGFPALRSLMLAGLDALTANQLQQALEGAYNLSELVLDGCGTLASLVLTLPGLRSISLRGCRSLASLDLHCRRLEAMQLGPPVGVVHGSTALRRVKLSSDAMRSLSWRHFPSLEAVELDCPSLISLSLVDCDSLTDEMLQTLWDVEESWPARNIGGSGSSSGTMVQLHHHRHHPPARLAVAMAAGGAMPMQRARERRPSAADLLYEAPGGAGSTDVVMLHDFDEIDELAEELAVDAAPPAAIMAGEWQHVMRLQAQPLALPVVVRPRPPPTPAPQPIVRPRVGGCPRLRELRLEACEGLSCCRLRHNSLASLTLRGCKGLRTLDLACPSLATLNVDECDDLAMLQMAPAAVESLSLGSCSSLSRVALCCPTLECLDLKGCGSLAAMELDCPRLTSLDATFCGGLTDAELGKALASAASSPLCSLVLSVCSSLGPAAPLALAALSGLTKLDISYTAVESLGPLLATCSGLRSLCLGSCRALDAACLEPLLLEQDPALPLLTDLDVSYCPLPPATATALLQRCGRRLQTLAMNGCDGVNDSIWTGLGPDGTLLPVMQQSAAGCSRGACHGLQYLSLVRCSRLRSLCLGLQPCAAEQQQMVGVGAAASVDLGHSGGLVLYEPKHYAFLDRQELERQARLTSWLPAATQLAQLRSLRLGLSGLQVLALALDHLTYLHLNGCSVLRQLELRCPALLTLNLQAGRMLAPAMAAGVLAGCPALEVLDVQHTREFGEETMRLTQQAHGAGGSLDGVADAGVETGDSEEIMHAVGAGGSTATMLGGGGPLRVLWCGPGCKVCRQPPRLSAAP